MRQGQQAITPQKQTVRKGVIRESKLPELLGDDAMDGGCDVFLRSLFINPIIWANWTMSQFLAPERTPSNRFDENQGPCSLSHGHNFQRT